LQVNELIDGMVRQAGANGGFVDLVEAFSLPLAFRVIYELMGVPVEVSGLGRKDVWREGVCGRRVGTAAVQGEVQTSRCPACPSKAPMHTVRHTVPPTCTAHTRVPQDYETLSSNVAVRASGSSNARDAAAAQEKLTAYMVSG
jgi:hypothetical protein